jgi:hypothetical protein
MATTKRRVNISLPAHTDIALKKLAKRDDVPDATKALELINLALEIEEDELLESIAAKRDTEDAVYVSHEEAWS